jgi:NADP-reducing hydrogenase subunit HndB
MAAVMDEVAKKNINDVQIRQTGCSGMCEKEVLLDIARPNEPRVTYGRVKPEDVPRIIENHLINGQIVGDLVVAKF